MGWTYPRKDCLRQERIYERGGWGQRYHTQEELMEKQICRLNWIIDMPKQFTSQAHVYVPTFILLYLYDFFKAHFC